MQWMRRSGGSWMGLGRAVGLALCLALVGSCNELARTDRAASFLVIDELIGFDDLGRPSNVLQSDVLSTNPPPTTVFQDLGQVATRLALKDPGTGVSPTTPSSANFITIDRYRVVYTRTDGGAVPLPLRGGGDVHDKRHHHGVRIYTGSPLGQAGAAARQPPEWRGARSLSPRSRRSPFSAATRAAARSPPRAESA